MSNKGRKVGHTTESCTPCRRAKIRCDSGNDNTKNTYTRLPCKTCLRQGKNCTWGKAPDFRRTNSKTALLTMIASLKAALANKTPQHDALARNLRLPKSALQRIGVEQLSTPQNRLMSGPNGIRRYGAPSAFYLKPENPGPVSTPPTIPSPSPSPLNNAGVTIPWDNILPLEKVSLSEAEHLELLNLFFNCFAFWGLRCHQDLFHQDMQAAFSPAPKKRQFSHWSPMLHNAILAVATAYSENPKLRNRDAREAFAMKAEEYMSEEIHSPTLCGVQAMSHLATFYTGLGEWAAGANFFGICASMTQALGLGEDASELVKDMAITEQEKDDREWLFLAIFLHDKLGALFRGRDILIPKPRIIRIPELPQEKPWLNVDLFRAQINLFSIATDIFQKVYRMGPVTRDDMEGLFNDTMSWGNNLPSSLRIADQKSSPIKREKLLLHLAFQWIILLLNLPFYQLPSTATAWMDWKERGLESCNLAADQVVHLFGLYDNLRQIPLMGIQVAFSAGLVFLSQMERLAPDSSQKQVAFEKFTKCCSFLEQMALTWQCANNSRKILEDLYRQSPTATLQHSNQMLEYLEPFAQHPIYSPPLDPMARPHCIPSTSSASNSRLPDPLIPPIYPQSDERMGVNPDNAEELPDTSSLQPLLPTLSEYHSDNSPLTLYPPQTLRLEPMFHPTQTLCPMRTPYPQVLRPVPKYHSTILPSPNPSTSYAPSTFSAPPPAEIQWLNPSAALHPKDLRTNSSLASAVSGTARAIPGIFDYTESFHRETTAPPKQERRREKDGWG